MPNVTIEIRRHYTRAEEEAIIAAVHAALMEGIKTPAWDKTIRLIVHEPHRFAVPPRCTDRYTLIAIDLFPGRSLEAKRALYQALFAISGNSEFLPAISKYFYARAARRTGIFEVAFRRPKSI